MKKILFTHTEDRMHWVGDGFPVRTVFSYQRHAELLSPFLMMDYASRMDFEPSEHIRGVGSHPHRGFETVTIVYAGEIDHRDSYGGGGSIGPGDVQWMTAGSGLVHEEMHGKNYSRRGGPFEMVQLWVNLPRIHKMTAPRYQGITDAQIPKVTLADGAGWVRVIAGDFEGTRGPTQTFSPVNVWDARLKAEHTVDLNLPPGFSASIFVLDGEVRADGKTLGRNTLAVFDRKSPRLTLEVIRDAKILVLSGEPIDEPIAGYGPFVMNTPDEIRQALEDFKAGKMGHID